MSLLAGIVLGALFGALVAAGFYLWLIRHEMRNW